MRGRLGKHVDRARQHAEDGEHHDRGGERIGKKAERHRAHQRRKDEAADNGRRDGRNEVLRQKGRIQNGEQGEDTERCFCPHHACTKPACGAAFYTALCAALRWGVVHAAHASPAFSGGG